MSKLQRDSAGLAAFLKSDGMQQAVTQVATNVMREAIRRAPHGKTDRYAESFRVEPGVISVSKRSGPRAGARVINESPYAAAVDFRHHFILSGLANKGEGL